MISFVKNFKFDYYEKGILFFCVGFYGGYDYVYDILQ